MNSLLYVDGRTIPLYERFSLEIQNGQQGEAYARHDGAFAWNSESIKARKDNKFG